MAEYKHFAYWMPSKKASENSMKFHSECIVNIPVESKSNDSIKLSYDEKEVHGLDAIPFRSIPALKIGQLAVDKRYREACKGYGSYFIELAIGFAVKMSESDYGTVCRYITVDVDTRNDTDEASLTEFYIKNDLSLMKSIIEINASSQKACGWIYICSGVKAF